MESDIIRSHVLPEQFSILIVDDDPTNLRLLQ